MPDITLVLVIAVVVLLGIVAWLTIQRQKTQQLRTRFGREYDRAVEAAGSRRDAETDLANRARRVEEFDIRPLDPADRQRYADEWRRLQGRFVDDPTGAIRGADDLINQVLEARGYPMEDFGRRVDDLSVDHGDVVEHYRVAHRIAEQTRGVAMADTESLRQALVHYRALFTSLLGDRPDDRPAAGELHRGEPEAAEHTGATGPSAADPRRGDREAADTDEPVGTRRTT